MTRSTSRKPPGLRRLAAAVAAGLLCAGATLFVTAAPAAAKASLKVSKTTGLKDGDSITVTGTGFTKGLTDLALGQCVKNPTGPTDCNLSGGAVFAKTDSSGKTEKVTLKLSKSFNGKECGTDGCVIAAQLLPSAHDDATVKANAVSVKIVFGLPVPPPRRRPPPSPPPPRRQRPPPPMTTLFRRPGPAWSGPPSY